MRYFITNLFNRVLLNPGLKRSEWDKFDEKVEKKVKEIIDKLKQSHTKFEDPDFGPTAKDEYGAISFYGNGKPDPAGSKYPAPETLKWERPRYDDKIFGENNSSKTDDNNEEKGDDSEENENNEDDGEVDEEEDEYGFSFNNNDDEVYTQFPFILFFVEIYDTYFLDRYGANTEDCF